MENAYKQIMHLMGNIKKRSIETMNIEENEMKMVIIITINIKIIK